MDAIKLYTKEGCQPCERVKEYLATRPELKVEIKLCKTQEDVMEFINYSQTFPTLVTGWGFVTHSDKIVDFLKTVS